MGGRHNTRRLRHWKFVVPVWDQPMSLAVGPYEQWEQFMDRRYGVPLDDLGKRFPLAKTIRITRTGKNTQSVVCIWLNAYNDRDSEDVAILAHEALHAAHKTVAGVGLGPMNNETEEAYAYLVSHIMRRCLERLRRR